MKTLPRSIIFLIIAILAFLSFSGCSQQPAEPPLTTSDSQPSPEKPDESSAKLWETPRRGRNPYMTAPPTDPSILENLDPWGKAVCDYWVAFSSYDLEAALDYWEESRREQEREGVEKEIGMIQKFRVTLTVQEILESVIISEGKAQVRIRLGTPIGFKYLKYELVEVEGEWKICSESGYKPTD